jgi:hypothetical protein
MIAPMLPEQSYCHTENGAAANDGAAGSYLISTHLSCPIRSR